MTRTFKVLLLISTLAVLLRITAVFVINDYEHPNAWEYGEIARNVCTGKGYSFNWFNDQKPIPSSIQAPFYVYFLVAVNSLPHKFLFIEIFQSVIWGLTCLLTYGIIRELGEDKRLALFAAIGIAIYPALVFSATQIHHTTFSFALVTGALWAFLQARRTRSHRAALSAGLLLGIYALNEPVLLSSIPLIILWFVWRRKSNLAPAFLIIIATFAAILPWTVRNVYVHKAPVFVKSGLWQVMWIGNNPAATGSLYNDESRPIFTYEKTPELNEKLHKAATESERSAILREDVLRYVKNNPCNVLTTDLKKISYLWWYDPYHPKDGHPLNRIPWQFLLLLAGAGAILKGREFVKYTPILLMIFTYGLAYAIFVPSPRYKFIFIPYLLAFAGTTIVTAFDDFKSFFAKRIKNGKQSP